MRSNTARGSVKSLDQETRIRLLNVAARLFAARGFAKVTVRDISSAARANVAAVNYYFGDKLGLYRSIVELAVDEMRAINDAARRAGKDGSPVEKLRSFIEVYVSRTTTRDPWIPQIVTREVADRTAVVDLIVERVLRPRMEYLAEIIAGILDCPPDDERVGRCVTCVQSQCFAFVPNPVSTRLRRDPPPTPGTIAAVAAHVTVFSLAGIRAVGKTSARSVATPVARAHKGRLSKAVPRRRPAANTPAGLAR